jgi:putative N-acetylmannosamine-6-phosphate epimerase
MPHLLDLFRQCPIVASVQADEGTPLAEPQILLQLARASLREGVRLLRLEGRDTIQLIKGETGAPVIGLIKRRYPASEVYITPTRLEVDELLASGCEVIALDATHRPRPGGEQLRDLVRHIRDSGRLAMADCDDPESVEFALEAGADLIGTTLAGYTAAKPHSVGPDLDFLRDAVKHAHGRPVLAEGRYSEPAQIQAALRIGAAAVVVGGAINDPIKQTRAFVQAAQRPEGAVGAVDMGGTWLRFGVFDRDWQLHHVHKSPLPKTREERLRWIKEQVGGSGITRLGISAGGTIDPQTGEVVEAKSLIPDHVGTVLSATTLGVPTLALNDGIATSWGHACHADFAGKRLVTLALGTGVGCGVVDRQRLIMGPRGEYPRLNDLPLGGEATVEEALGGASIQSTAAEKGARGRARIMSLRAIKVADQLYLPDDIVICGGVGLSKWLGVAESLDQFKARLMESPFGEDAGLYGAAALALFPPVELAHVFEG